MARLLPCLSISFLYEAHYQLTTLPIRFHDGNRLMAFVDASTRAVLSFKNYRMRFMIIMQVLTADSAYMSEHIVSRLASSYVTCTGMNTTMGGASTTSASSAKGTVFEAAVKAGGEQLYDSVYEELGRVQERRNKLQVVANSQKHQRELRGLLGQEQQLRDAADKEEGLLTEENVKMENFVGGVAERVEKDVASANASRLMDGVVENLVGLLESKFNGMGLD